MNNVLNSIKLDYYILKSSDLRRMAIIALVPLIAGIVGKNPLLIVGLTMTLFGFVMSMIFATVEKSNLNKLYGILPVGKSQTVIGRYLFTFLAGIAIAALASLLAFAAAFFLKINLEGFTFAAWLSGSFFLFCLLVSAQFPLYFKYDFSKLAAFANLPYILIILAVTFLVKKYPALFTQTIKFFVHNPYMIWVLGIAGSLLLLGISTFISIGLYKNREL
jgi:ABC-2 type transport system permease protein